MPGIDDHSPVNRNRVIVSAKKMNKRPKISETTAVGGSNGNIEIQQPSPSWTEFESTKLADFPLQNHGRSVS